MLGFLMCPPNTLNQYRKTYFHDLSDLLYFTLLQLRHPQNLFSFLFLDRRYLLDANSPYIYHVLNNKFLFQFQLISKLSHTIYPKMVFYLLFLLLLYFLLFLLF